MRASSSSSAKWFCDVVVGAQRQTLDFVFLLASCRENDDCRAGLLCGQPAAYFEPIQAGKRQVQQDQIRFESLAFPERAAAIAGQGHIEAFINQVVAKYSRQRGVVFDDQDSPLHWPDSLLPIGSRISATVPEPGTLSSLT